MQTFFKITARPVFSRKFSRKFIESLLKFREAPLVFCEVFESKNLEKYANFLFLSTVLQLFSIK